MTRAGSCRHTRAKSRPFRLRTRCRSRSRSSGATNYPTFGRSLLSASPELNPPDALFSSCFCRAQKRSMASGTTPIGLCNPFLCREDLPRVCAGRRPRTVDPFAVYELGERMPSATTPTSDFRRGTRGLRRAAAWHLRSSWCHDRVLPGPCGLNRAQRRQLLSERTETVLGE